MKPSNDKHLGEAATGHPEEEWIVAYENYVYEGGREPEPISANLPDEAQQHFDEIRQTIEALHAVYGQDVEAPESSTSEPPPQQLGDFRILDEIGRGGMGVVYEAQQISLSRRVALKILPFAAVLDPRQLERFKNEARAAATLHHPGIVAVYSVGTERGVHFFAMEFIEGQSLAEVIEELQPDSQNERETIVGYDSEKQPASTPVWQSHLSGDSNHKQAFFHLVARLGAQTAVALDHAHTRGIVHRDIKPGNLLLDTEGQIHVADFGLARMGEDAGVTMTGDVLGTLRYMSPEQALARRAVIDHRTDIYSLGATLYELLTLRQLFKGRDRQEILRKIAQEEPKRPGKLNPKIPADLETIVLKAISKDPNERYATARELADDLRAFLENRSILAKPPSLANRLVKWSRRHVAIVWTLVLGLLMLSTGLGISAAAISASRNTAEQERETAEEQRSQAERERQVAVEQRSLAQKNLYYAEMVAGQMQVDSGNTGGLYSDLLNYLPLSNEEDARDWEWYYLLSKCRPEDRTITIPWLTPFAAWSPDGEHIGTPGAIWEADTGKCIRRFSASSIKTDCVAWSPDGQKFAWGMVSDEDAFYIWDRPSDTVSRFAGHTSSVWCLAWSPDSSQIASGSLDITIKIWDVASETVQWTATKCGKPVSLAWSPDGKLLAAANASSNLQVWDVADRKLFDKRLKLGALRSVSWHPKGDMLAVCGDQAWYLLETNNWKVMHEVELSRAGRAINYSPDGSLIAVAHSGTVSIWNAIGEGKLAEFNGHRNPVFSLSWHPDGRRLVSGDESWEVKIWDLDRQESATIATEIDIGSIKWLDDNETLSIVDSEDRSMALWGVCDGAEKERKTIAVEDPIAVSPDRKLAAVYNEDEHSISIRDATTDTNRAVIKVGPKRHFHSITFSRDGTNAAVQSKADNVLFVEVWNVDQEQFLWTWESNRPLRHLIWNADGSRFAGVGVGALGEDGSVYWRDHLYIFDVNQGKLAVKHLPTGRNRVDITALAWSCDGRFVALGSANGLLEVIDAVSGELRFPEMIHRDGIAAIAWHPLDNRLATAIRDGEVKIVSSEDGKVLANFAPLQNSVITIAWSNDGQRLAAATSQGEIKTWDASPGYEISSGDARRGELAWAYYDRSKKASEENYVDSLKATLRHAPDDLGFWQVRGDAYAELGEFGRAAAEFSKAVGPELRYSYYPAYCRAAALQGAGQLEEFHQASAEFVEAFQDSPVPSNRGNAAWLASLTFNPHVDSANLVAMARVSFDENGSDGWNKWKLALGCALYRDGQHEEANHLLTELATKLGSDGDWKTSYEVACAKYFLSMSRLSLGHKFQAQRLLEEANDLTDAYLVHVPGRYWRKIVALRTLRHEATLMNEE